MDKATITLISQISCYNNPFNVYILSKNLLMVTNVNFAIIVAQNLLRWKQDGYRRVWYEVIFVFTTSEKALKTWRKSSSFGYRKSLINVSFFVHFLAFVKQARIFLNFIGKWFFLLNKSGGFLNLFSWLLYSESISISILLNLSFKRWLKLWRKQR